MQHAYCVAPWEGTWSKHKNVRSVVAGIHRAHLDHLVSYALADLQVAAVDMPRKPTGMLLARQLKVHLELCRPIGGHAQHLEKAAKMDDFGGGM
eukprot:2540088-Pleurochrysis_carterae.AAC.4